MLAKCNFTEIEVLKAQLEQMSNRQEQQFHILNNNVHRVRIQPVHVIQNQAAGAIAKGVVGDAADEENPAPVTASLSHMNLALEGTNLHVTSMQQSMV